MLVPGALQALQNFAKCVERSGLPAKTLELIHLRASQINGCGVCLDLHYKMAKSKGESEERLFALAGWRDTPYFSDAERAALALTEAVTRMSDRSDPVPDAIWNEAAQHYSDEALAALVLAIASINVWNRLNVTTRQVAGEWAKSDDARKWVEEHVAAAR
jgi:AhpD family alkylhydroperoxidase